jgi:predicted amino acid racemase
MDLIASLDGNCAEPGHALTGTTPLHADAVQPEIPGYVYVTQVSHNHDGKASLFGGGHYRRSHMKQAFVGENLETGKRMTVQEPEVHSIDYHFDLDGEAPVSAPAILCYRTQMFTTRSKVAVVSGIQSGKPELLGLYDGLGHPLERIWK